MTDALAGTLLRRTNTVCYRCLIMTIVRRASWYDGADDEEGKP